VNVSLLIFGRRMASPCFSRALQPCRNTRQARRTRLPEQVRWRGRRRDL